MKFRRLRNLHTSDLKNFCLFLLKMFDLSILLNFMTFNSP